MARESAPISLRFYLTFRHSNLLRGGSIELQIYNSRNRQLEPRTKVLISSNMIYSLFSIKLHENEHLIRQVYYMYFYVAQIQICFYSFHLGFYESCLETSLGAKDEQILKECLKISQKSVRFHTVHTALKSLNKPHNV